MVGDMITEQMMDAFYAVEGVTKKRLRWRMTEMTWHRCCAEIKRVVPIVELDPQTKRLPTSFLGVPVVFDPLAPHPFVLELEDPIARSLAKWEARPPGPDGTKPC